MLSDLTLKSLLGKAQLVRLLQIHPEFCCGSEKRRQTHRGIARDASLSFDNCRDPVHRNLDRRGNPVNTPAGNPKVMRV